MSELDRQRIQTAIEHFGETLDGDWLLVGGAVVAVWFDPLRVTSDIDITPVEPVPTTAQRLALLEAAESLGLSVETVNSAVDYFVRRIADWPQQIEVLHRGPRGTVFRPTATLFLLLKIRRLSEEDLSDCMGLLAHARCVGLAVDAVRVVSELDGLGPTPDARLQARRNQLRSALSVVCSVP